ncbi:MAG: tRNA dihydrouridine synthase DusB [Clostridia bacterium]|nr:tRNA dihydrouridine synthase DusB [Clostridia bacterium]
MTDFCGFTPKNRFFLAPMAGITDAAFRTVCAEQGAAVTYTEMVSARALVYEDKKTASLLEMQPEHRPCGAQLFGNEPDIMAEAAVRAAAICKPEFLDINMGCPMPKIFNNGDGSALMGDPERAAAIVTAMKKAVDLPVTVKFRSGIREDSRNCVEFAKRMEAAGADAMCIHGRTRVQMYSGKSDRNMVTAVKAAVSVPVIASGDALSGRDCLDILDETGADFIMIARGAEGYPMIFKDCLALEAGLPKPEYTAKEVLDVMRRHARLTCALKAEHRAMPELRKHMLWYLGNLRGAKSYKPRMAQINTMEEFLSLCEELEQQGFDLKG